MFHGRSFFFCAWCLRCVFRVLAAPDGYSMRPLLRLDSRAQLRLESSLQDVHHHHFIAPLPFRLFEADTHTCREFGTKSRAVATAVEPPIILPAVTTDQESCE